MCSSCDLTISTTDFQPRGQCLTHTHRCSSQEGIMNGSSQNCTNYPDKSLTSKGTALKLNYNKIEVCMPPADDGRVYPSHQTKLSPCSMHTWLAVLTELLKHTSYFQYQRQNTCIDINEYYNDIISITARSE